MRSHLDDSQAAASATRSAIEARWGLAVAMASRKPTILGLGLVGLATR